MKHEAFSYLGCEVVPESHPTGIYFGVRPRDDGYQTDFVRVTFPDNTWVRCAGPAEARRYIDANLEDHAAGPAAHPIRQPVGCPEQG